MKKFSVAINSAFLFVSFCLLATKALSAPGVSSMQNVTYGVNVYAPTLALDPSSNQLRLWFGGQLDSIGNINDAIYHLQAADAEGKNWESRTNTKAVLVPQDPMLIAAMQLEVRKQIQSGENPLNEPCLTDTTKCISHVNDPSVSIIKNSINGSIQYTMFFTLCPWPCREIADFNQSEIWSVVSADGLRWTHPQVVLRGTQLGPAEPSVIYDPDNNGVWKLYYINRLQSTQVQMSRINGLRLPTSTQTVYSWNRGSIISSIEVRKMGSTYSLFFNQWNGYALVDKIGYAQSINIYQVDSNVPTGWATGKETALVTANPASGICGLITPAVYPSPTNPAQFQLFFAMLPTRTSSSGVQFCDLLGNFNLKTPEWIAQWQFQQ